MTVFSVAAFQWPALKTSEVEFARDASKIRNSLADWCAICQRKIRVLPHSVASDVLWDIELLIRHLEIVFTKDSIGSDRAFVVLDKEQSIQGIAVVRENESAVEIRTLTTSPENIGSNRKWRGVGKLLIKRIAYEHLMKNCTKPIELIPVDRSIGFYAKLGFQGAESVRRTNFMYVAADRVKLLYEACRG